MKRKGLIALLILACVGLGGASAYLLMGEDKEAPVITVSHEDMTYTEGDDYDELLEGVTATDNQDGDVSNDVFVSGVLQTSENEAIVSYAVVDSSSNVGTAKRTVEYIANDDKDAADSDEDAADDEDTSESDSDTVSSDDTADTETTTTDDASTDSAATVSPSATPSPTPTESADDASVQDLTVTGTSPVIALTQSEVKIKKGETFSSLDQVLGVADDKDETYDLYKRISVQGTYDVNTAGTYELSYFVTDSDGNVSEVKTLKLVVE